LLKASIDSTPFLHNALLENPDLNFESFPSCLSEDLKTSFESKRYDKDFTSTLNEMENRIQTDSS
jgi:hypothetical protein